MERRQRTPHRAVEPGLAPRARCVLLLAIAGTLAGAVLADATPPTYVATLTLRDQTKELDRGLVYDGVFRGPFTTRDRGSQFLDDCFESAKKAFLGLGK